MVRVYWMEVGGVLVTGAGWLCEAAHPQAKRGSAGRGKQRPGTGGARRMNPFRSPTNKTWYEPRSHALPAPNEHTLLSGSVSQASSSPLSSLISCVVVHGPSPSLCGEARGRRVNSRPGAEMGYAASTSPAIAKSRGKYTSFPPGLAACPMATAICLDSLAELQAEAQVAAVVVLTPCQA